MNGMNRDASSVVSTRSSVIVRPSVRRPAREFHRRSFVARRSSLVVRRSSSSTMRRVDARARGRAHDEPRVMTRYESHPSIPARVSTARVVPARVLSQKYEYMGIQYLQYTYGTRHGGLCLTPLHIKINRHHMDVFHH